MFSFAISLAHKSDSCIRHLSSFQEHTSALTIKSTTEEDKITKYYDKRDDNIFQQSTYYSSAAIFQQCIEFILYNSRVLPGLVSTTGIFWTMLSCWHKCYSNKAVEVSSIKIITIVVTKWLTITKYPFLKWQLMFPLLRRFSFSSVMGKTFTGIWVMWGVSCKKQELLTLRENLNSTPSFWWVYVAHLFYLCSVFSFVCLYYMSSVRCYICHWIVHYWLHFRLSLMFITTHK